MLTLGRLVVCLSLLLGLGWSGQGASSSVSAPLTYRGMCDASGGVALGANLFAVADDEGNQIRIYRFDTGGLPQQVIDVGSFLNLVDGYPETDLEGAAWLGGQVYWIGSHGRNREGKHRPNRHCFFATTVDQTTNGFRLVPVGANYKRLVKDLDKDARLKPFGLAAAAKRAPKSRGALNIEGLCAYGPDALLIGFRNPIPTGRALLVPMLNPGRALLGRPAHFGTPILLDLGGLGVRDLVNWQGKILVLAGPYDTEKDFRLFVWDGGASRPEEVPGLDFRGLTPEALVAFPQTSSFLVLSDDGTLKIQGIECKHLADPAQRRFQAVWVAP
jgi:hypothetical protein